MINGWIDCIFFKLILIFFVVVIGLEIILDDYYLRARRLDFILGILISDGGWVGVLGKYVLNGLIGFFFRFLGG